MLIAYLIQGSDTQYPKKVGFGSKTCWKNARQKTAPNLIQFQFDVPIIVKDFFIFTASSEQ